MIGAYFYPYNLAPNKDSIPQVNAGNKNSGNEGLGFQTERAEKSADEMLLNSLWEEETKRMSTDNFLESRDRREGKRGKHQSTVIMPLKGEILILLFNLSMKQALLLVK